MSDRNGWISIDDARFPLPKYVGDEIVIRTKANNGRWVYQIAIVDEDGKVVIGPCAMCSQCGGALQWKPHAKLIAAAPEMLEVLRWLDAEMDCRDDEYGGVLFSRGDFEKVRLAIKLAMEG